MKKDIEIPSVEGVSVAVVKELNEEKTYEVYNVYILNLKEVELTNVMVSSKGYGINSLTEERINTSVLRHFLGNIGAKSIAKIEPIVEEVFGINNEYWVSFFDGDRMFDKKYIFLAETIIESNMIKVPLMEDARGVVI
jgi:hypothetical protein